MKVFNDKLRPILSIDVIFVLLFLLQPMLPYFRFKLRGFIFAWSIFLIWFLLIALKRNLFKNFLVELKSRKKYFFWIILFVLVSLVNYLFVNTTNKGFNYTVNFINVVLLLIIDAYYSLKPIKYRFSILFYIVVILGLQAVISIPYIISNGAFISRLLASGQLDAQASVEAMKNGVGNNGLYTTVGAIAILGFAISTYFKKVFKIIIIISSISLLLSVFISTYMASILMIVVGGLILISRYNKRIFKFKIIIPVISLVIGFVYFYNNYVKETSLLKPIIQKITKYQNQGGDITGRGALADASLDTFINNPFFGIGVPPMHSYDIVGEHMPWIDFFANFGFFGFLPFLIFIFLLIKNSYSFYFINDQHKFYRTACLAGFIIFMISNSISPMMTVPSMITFVMLCFLSIDNSNIFLKQ